MSTVGVGGELCYFANDSPGFPVLLPFFDAPSGGSFHPSPCYPSPPARTWRCPFHRHGVTSPQTPTPAPESFPATIPQSMRMGPHSCFAAPIGSLLPGAYRKRGSTQFHRAITDEFGYP